MSLQKWQDWTNKYCQSRYYLSNELIFYNEATSFLIPVNKVCKAWSNWKFSSKKWTNMSIGTQNQQTNSSNSWLIIRDNTCKILTTRAKELDNNGWMSDYLIIFSRMFSLSFIIDWLANRKTHKLAKKVHGYIAGYSGQHTVLYYINYVQKDCNSPIKIIIYSHL